MVLIPDNSESVFDPQGTGSHDIYIVVQELSRLNNICLHLPYLHRSPTLQGSGHVYISIESTCDIFYGTYDICGRSNTIRTPFRQLGFHALSTTLLATTASHDMWDLGRLAKEQNIHHTQVLRPEIIPTPPYNQGSMLQPAVSQR